MFGYLQKVVFKRTLVYTSNANPWFWRVRNIKEKVKEDLLAEGKHLEKRQERIKLQTVFTYDIRGQGILVWHLIV